MVSIIVTHKKDTLYLKDCLESIAEQQFKDYETILVVDHKNSFVILKLLFGNLRITKLFL